MTPSRLRTRFAVWAALACALCAACAVSVPPSGGPEDKTPPKVEATVPARDSAGVSTDSDIRIAFSEPMTHARAERMVSFSPEVVIGKAGWDGSTLVLRPEGGLRRDTTYVVTLAAGFKDRHGVGAREDFRFAFATSAQIDSGRVSGTVLFRREPSENAVAMCYVLPVDSGFTAGGTRPDRLAAADGKGRYELDYLPTNDCRILVWAFEDKNKNLAFDPDGDIGLAAPDTVTLSAGAPAAVVNLAVVDPDEPAVVRGRVVDASGIDSIAVSVALYADTVKAPLYYLRCDTTGAYELRSVHAGEYELRAFVDVVADSVCGVYPCGPDSSQTCTEPCAVHPDRIVLAPGDMRVMSPIELGPAPAARKEP